MWNYQEIFFQRNIHWVIETGSRHGGSGLFFADILSAMNAEGVVYSIDIDTHSNRAPSHPKLEFLVGDSGSRTLAKKIFENIPLDRKPLFLILDSDHKKSHVLKELEAFVPFLKSGDYLVVEDTCVNGHPVRPDFGDGPYEAIHEYLTLHPGILISDKERETKFGATFAPDGYYLVK